MRIRSGALNVRRLLAFRPLHHVELNLLTFLQAFEAGHLNRAEVREQILTTVIRGDEAETLSVVKPLDSTRCHIEAFNEMCSQVGQEPSNEVMPDEIGAFASRSDQLPRPAPPVGNARHPRPPCHPLACGLETPVLPGI